MSSHVCNCAGTAPDYPQHETYCGQEPDELCHCGEPIDREVFRDRGMCTHCDDRRCDAYPGACGRR